MNDSMHPNPDENTIPAEVEMESRSKFLQHFPDWARLVSATVLVIFALAGIYYTVRGNILELQRGFLRIETVVAKSMEEGKKQRKEADKRITHLEQQYKLQQLLLGGIKDLQKGLGRLKDRVHTQEVELIRLKTLFGSTKKARGP